jgi:hypothetical protein
MHSKTPSKTNGGIGVRAVLVGGMERWWCLRSKEVRTHVASNTRVT